MYKEVDFILLGVVSKTRNQAFTRDLQIQVSLRKCQTRYSFTSYLDIREFRLCTSEDPEVFLPTNHGITLKTVDQVKELIATLQKAVALFEEANEQVIEIQANVEERVAADRALLERLLTLTRPPEKM